MAPQIVYVCTTGAGQHVRASAHCGQHNRSTEPTCSGCGEHLWDGGHRCP
jgi:hypothetical protein